MTVTPPDTPASMREPGRGEVEWRAWLDDLGVLGPAEWTAALQQEIATLLGRGDRSGAVRLLEQVVSPASPAFDAFTGPKARAFAAALEAMWTAAHPEGIAPEDPWDERFREVATALRSWVRYRRRRRAEGGTAGPRRGPAGTRQEPEEDFYRQWVLAPLRENILRVLDDRGITRRQFCSRLGISEAYLSQILNGRRNPSLRRMAGISRELQVDLGRLFTIRAVGTGGSPWSAGEARPEPGDTGTWYPGKVSRPYAALEAHYRMVPYPGPDLPGEKIVARSFLVVDPIPGEPGFDQRYAIEDEEDRIVVASFSGAVPGGKRQRFVSAADGRTIETPVVAVGRVSERPARGQPWLLGRIMGTLVEFK